MKDWKVIEYIYNKYSDIRNNRDSSEWCNCWHLALRSLDYDWKDEKQLNLVGYFVNAASTLIELRSRSRDTRPNIRILYRKSEEANFKSRILTRINRYRQKHWIWKEFKILK